MCYSLLSPSHSLTPSYVVICAIADLAAMVCYHCYQFGNLIYAHVM